jgi:drug/metabolite transporter (DMT)-like permease
MGVLLGLATALSWGISDFISRFVSQKAGALRTSFYMQAWGFVFLTCVLFRLPGTNHLFDGSGWHPWAWGALAGSLNTVAMLALYHAFTIGKLSIVAPVSASYPVLTVVLSVFSGERLTLFRALGIVATILGVVLVARGESAALTSDRGNLSRVAGLVPALVAAVCFGVLFWLLGMRIISATGAFAAVWLIRATGMVLLFAILVIRRAPIRLPGRGTAIQSLGTGILDTGAFLLSNRGMQLEQVSIVTLLSSLYGAVTVALAAIFLREPVSRWQWCGVVLIFVGIILVAR